MNKKAKKLISVLLLCSFAVFGLAGCKDKEEAAAPEEVDPEIQNAPIKIGATTLPEHLIIQEMVAQLIEENTDLKVERLAPIDGSPDELQALYEKGEADIIPQYMSMGWTNILGHSIDTMPKEDVKEALTAEYEEKYGSRWIGTIGYERSVALAVRPETIAKYELETISDLAEVSSELTLGADADFLNDKEAYQALAKTYGLHFQDAQEISDEEKFQALDEKKCDVINIMSTDSRIADYGTVIVKDDLSFFPDNRSSLVVRNDIITAHPELEKLLKSTKKLISLTEMTNLNYQLNTIKRPVADIATDYLVSQDLIEKVEEEEVEEPSTTGKKK